MVCGCWVDLWMNYVLSMFSLDFSLNIMRFCVRCVCKCWSIFVVLVCGVWNMVRGL